MGNLRADSELRSAVRSVYSAIGDRPGGDHPIAVGRALAEGIGYPPGLLDQMPSDAVEVFAGVSYLHGFADLAADDVVLDLGCGGGLDSLIAGRRAGQVVGVDFSESMLARAGRAMAAIGAINIGLRLADAEAIPLGDATVDAALVNGIFNLNPGREQLFKELARVLRPGGHAYVAELILSEPRRPDAAAGEDDWFS